MPQPCPQRVRRGVTLLELLVVLTLMGAAAALVAPALGRWPSSGPSGSEAAVAAVITSARRQAIRRAEPLRVRVAADGVWALVSQRDGTVIDSGRVALTDDATSPTMDVLIDALGTCMPPAGRVGDAALDVLTCTSGGARLLPIAEAR